MTDRLLIAVSFVFLLAGRTGLGAEIPDWRSWRGPLANGSVERGTWPEKFDAEHYLWRTELPGKGCSTPILLDGMIYLTCPADGHDALLCYDFNGKEQWRAVFGQENAGKHRNGSGSNASPVTDGKTVFVYFKSGTFAAVELDAPRADVAWSGTVAIEVGQILVTSVTSRVLSLDEIRDRVELLISSRPWQPASTLTLRREASILSSAARTGPCRT